MAQNWHRSGARPARRKSPRQGLPRLKQRPLCPACEGLGSVCCEAWALAKLDSAGDLEFSGLSMPLWPLSRLLEMNYCPFCGAGFRPRRK